MNNHDQNHTSRMVSFAESAMHDMGAIAAIFRVIEERATDDTARTLASHGRGIAEILANDANVLCEQAS